MVMVKIWGGMEGAGVRVDTGGVSKVLGWWPMMVKMEGESRVQVGVCGRQGKGRVIKMWGEVKGIFEMDLT